MCEALRPRPAWPTGQRVWGFSSSPAPATPRPQPNTQGEESTGTCLQAFLYHILGTQKPGILYFPDPQGTYPSPLQGTLHHCAD